MSNKARAARAEALPEDFPDTSNYQRRLRAVSMVRHGATIAATARALQISTSSVRRWLRVSAVRGDHALGFPEKGGRPGALSGRSMSELAAALRKPPRELGYAAPRWSGALLARHLRERHSLSISPRQGRRLMRSLGAATPVHAIRNYRSLGKLSVPRPLDKTLSRPRPAWDGLNKEVALRRIKRLASSGLPLEPLIQTLFKLINDAVPNAPNRPFLAGGGDRPDAYVGDTPEVHAIVPEHQRFYAHSPSELSGLSVPFDAHTFTHILPGKSTWLLEEFMLPHFYRSEGFNQVFRGLGYHHMVHAIFLEHGEPAGFYPIWRSTDQPPFGREDIRFLNAIIPHVAHGLKAARLLTGGGGESACGAFTPTGRWGSGIVLMDPAGRVIAADDCARSLFGYLERFDTNIDGASKTCETHDALGYIARVLNRIFRRDGETGRATPSPVVRLYSHWSGLVFRLRGVMAQGADADYFTVLVEQGELAQHRRGRLRYRWGLSARETDILIAMSDGKKSAEIAAAMSLRRDTLKSYTRRLMDKLDLADGVSLRTFARDNFAAQLS